MSGDSSAKEKEVVEEKVSILIVDDRPDKMLAYEAILRDLKENIVCARSGKEALRCLLKQDFAVILLDVNMPGLDGFETAQLIRERPSSRHIPIIFAAAPIDEFNEQDAKNAGADVILRKPFEASSLLGEVQQLLERSAIATGNGSATGKSGLDRHSIRAAVTLALDSAMPAMIDELTERVVLALSHRV